MVAGISMVCDEADIIEQTVSRMAAQVDFLIVADNGSTDGTRDILDRLSETLSLNVVTDPEQGYFQSRKVSTLAERARRAGADWVVPFDADEVWLPREGHRIAEVLTALPENILIASADLYDHVATAKDPKGDPITRMQWRREYPAELPKVAVRALEGLTIHQGNHSASFEHTDLPPAVSNLLTVAHFPYRSVEQLVRKVRNGAAAYAATDLPDDAGAHWRQYGRILEESGEEGIAELFRTWYWRAEPNKAVCIEGERQPALVHDPVG